MRCAASVDDGTWARIERAVDELAADFVAAELAAIRPAGAPRAAAEGMLRDALRVVELLEGHAGGDQTAPRVM